MRANRILGTPQNIPQNNMVEFIVAILDDWGPDRLNASQRRDLMEIVEDRYGNGSTRVMTESGVWGV